jgi:two-component system response regulator AtoC
MLEQSTPSTVSGHQRPEGTDSATLLLTRAGQAWAVRTLRPNEALTVGRAASCDVRVDGDPRVSREHLRVTYDGSLVRVVDLGSRNGVLVNDLRVVESTLRTNGWFEVGSLRGTVLLPTPASPPDRTARPTTAASALRLEARSPAMSALAELLPRIAAASVSVLVLGETGSGKDVVANHLHASGPRRDGPLHVVNCGAIPEHLAESTLFGHERGAFTDASAMRAGAFELAHGGTLFLDEVAELAPNVQAKLLRVLETRRLVRIGGTREVTVDVRVISATHRNLARMVEDGSFRRDLYYRLNTMQLVIPPLRERQDDIEPLAKRILQQIGNSAGEMPHSLDVLALEWLRRRSWPGNVRELGNLLIRAALVANSKVLRVADLRNASEMDAWLREVPAGGLRQQLFDFEREILRKALEHANGNRTRAAELLEVPVRTLVYKIRALRLRDEV